MGPEGVPATCPQGAAVGCKKRPRPVEDGRGSLSQDGLTMGWAHEPSTTYPLAQSAVCPLADKQFQAGL